TPWLGIIGGTVTREIATYYNLPVDKGVLVAEIVPGSPADQAGLRQGDVITAFNLIAIETIEDLTGALEKARVGDKVQLTVVRQGGNRQTIAVILGERPQE
ncbi:MAG: PDZ domain-containing protein, partial [bacterium]